jgi:acyl-CoA synthetase (AMP-forming)/AMP-acid ligase II
VTLLELDRPSAGRQHRDRASRSGDPRLLPATSRSGLRNGRCARLPRNLARRPRRHVPPERPARHREFPRRVRRRDRRAAQSRLPRRRGRLSISKTPPPKSCYAPRTPRPPVKAAETRGVPVYALEMDATGYVRIAGAPSGKTASAPSAEDVALILHTSGSTGRPKRVPILHGNMAASTHNIVKSIIRSRRRTFRSA